MKMDTLGIVTTVISLGIFLLALYESAMVSKMSGRIPTFWLFFLAAILFVIVRRILVLLAGTVLSVPAYWYTIDADGTPIVFSSLLLMFVWEMKKSFQRTSASQGESAAP